LSNFILRGYYISCSNRLKKYAIEEGRATFKKESLRSAILYLLAGIYLRTYYSQLYQFLKEWTSRKKLVHIDYDFLLVFAVNSEILFCTLSL
jgi:hypothetical protein